MVTELTRTQEATEVMVDGATAQTTAPAGQEAGMPAVLTRTWLERTGSHLACSCTGASRRLYERLPQ